MDSDGKNSSFQLGYTLVGNTKNKDSAKPCSDTANRDDEDRSTRKHPSRQVTMSVPISEASGGQTATSRVRYIDESSWMQQ